MQARMLPWTDRTGRFSALKASTLIVLTLPALYLLARALAGDLGARPAETALKVAGDAAIAFLLLSLTVTPLRHVTGRTRVIIVRRLIGLGALAYALGHLTLHVIDQRLDVLKVATEIASRVYLTIGFGALLILCVLGVTSFDAAIRRLGAERWRRLHLLVHVAAVGALAHMIIQTRLDPTLAFVFAGLYLLLIGLRGLVKRRIALSPVVVVAAAAAAAAIVLAGEIAWFSLLRRVPVEVMLLAQVSFDVSIRPVWWVLAAGMALAAAAVMRSPHAPVEASSRRTQARTAG